MTSLLAIDPGKWHVGAALFAEGRLVFCQEPRVKAKGEALEATAALADIVKDSVKEYLDGSVDKAVFERPSVWTRGGSRGNPNDLLDLMATNGAVYLAVRPTEARYIPVGDWKGQVPKPIIEKRVRKRLDENELRVLGAASHNTVDAVGIGLFALRRMVKV